MNFIKSQQEEAEKAIADVWREKRSINDVAKQVVSQVVQNTADKIINEIESLYVNDHVRADLVARIKDITKEV